MGKVLPDYIISAFQFNLVDHISGELAFVDIQKLQYKLAIHAQTIWTPYRQIGHVAIVYCKPKYIQYNFFPWKTPNDGIEPIFFVQYPIGYIDQQIHNREQ